MSRTAAEKRGRGAETIAALWLRLHGWRILARRGRTLAFVEVKARATDEAAAFSLDAYRLRRVAVAAERLAQRYLRDGDELRIDAIFIVPRRWPRHLANIWLG